MADAARARAPFRDLVEETRGADRRFDQAPATFSPRTHGQWPVNYNRPSTLLSEPEITMLRNLLPRIPSAASSAKSFWSTCSITLTALLVAAFVMLGGVANAQQNDPQTAPDPSAEAPTAAETKSAQAVRGVVFHDQNHNRKRDEGEPPLAGIRVSNGRDITKTDEQGRYELPIDDDDIVFVIKPRNYRTPVDRKLLPQFYYIHKPNGSPKSKFPGVEPTGPLPESVDFPLYPSNEPDKFQAILFGDPQPRTRKELNFIEHDVIEELVGTKASFGVTLGDIVFDDLSLFEPQAKAIALLGIPWYNVIGNHDINFDARSDAHSDETFERVFGPAYYAFDHGPVHFIVIDNIEWVVKGEGRGRYVGGMGEEQLQFIREDLKLVPEEQMVVLLMHIPIIGMQDKESLFRLIENRPFCISISGHTHTHEHHFLTKADGWKGPKPHHHIINVTVSGSWWRGAPDERGIPHATMSDGGPNGYSIMTFDGVQYTLDYKAAGRPASYQMNVQAPDSLDANATEGEWIYANVFNGSEKTKVEMRVGDKQSEWMEMEKTREVDPLYRATLEHESKLKEKNWTPLPGPRASTHLWKAKLSKLPPGVHLIRVRATDRQGRVTLGSRILKVTSAAAADGG